jgi:hypothetical protein
MLNLIRLKTRNYLILNLKNMKKSAILSFTVKNVTRLIIAVGLLAAVSCSVSVCPAYADFNNTQSRSDVFVSSVNGSRKIASPYTKKYAETHKKRMQKSISKANKDNYLVSR